MIIDFKTNVQGVFQFKAMDSDVKKEVQIQHFEMSYSASVDFVANNIKTEPTDEVQIEEVSIYDLFMGGKDSIESEQEKTANRQKVVIVREDAGVDEFVKEEPVFYDEYNTQVDDVIDNSVPLNNDSENSTKQTVSFGDSSEMYEHDVKSILRGTYEKKKVPNSDSKNNNKIKTSRQSAQCVSKGKTPKSSSPSNKKPTLLQELKKKISSTTSNSVEKRIFECYMCQKHAGSAIYLKRHYDRFHEIESFGCNICSKRFTAKYLLKIHQRSHAGNKPSKCKFCRREFATKNYLRRHNETCTETLTCNICARKFELQLDLAEHMRKHIAEKPYFCDICPNQFANSRNLKRHRRLHTKVGMFRCSQCPKEYTTKWARDHHQLNRCNKSRS